MDMAELRVTAVDQASAVLAKIKGSADEASKSGENLKSVWNGGMMDGFTKGPALAAVGVIGALSAAAIGAGTYFVSLAKQVMESQAALKSMSEVTGASVEGLSAIRSIAKLTGIDMDSVAGGMTKLAKTVAQGGKETEKALNAIGLSLKDMQGLKTDEQFMKITEAMGHYADGSGKTAAAQLLLGKSGAQLLPLMKDLSEAGDLVARTTSAQALQADELEKNIKRLTIAKEAWKKVVGNALIPVLDDVVKVMLKMQTETNGTLKASKELAADGSIRSWAEGAVIGVAYLIDIVQALWGTFKAVGAGIAGIVAGQMTLLTGMGEAAVAVIKGEYSKIPGIVKSSAAGIKEIATAAGKDISAGFFPTLMSDRVKATFAESKQYAKDLAENMRYTGDTGKKVVGDLTKGSDDAEKALEKLRKEIDALFASFGADPTTTKNIALLDEALAKGIINSREYAKGMEEITKRSKATKEALDYLIAVQKVWNDLDEAAFQIGEKKLANIEAGIKSLREETESIRQETRLLGLSNEERTIAIALYKAQAAGIDTNTEAFAKMMAEMRQAVYGKAAVEETLKNLEDTRKASEQIWKGIGDDISNWIMSGFKNTRDLLKKMFETLVLRPMISPIADGITSTLQGILGGLSGGGGGGVGILGSLLGGAGSFGASASGAFGNVLASLFGAGGGLMEGIGSTIAGVAGGLSGVMGGSILSGLGQIAGALGPIGIAVGAVATLISHFTQRNNGFKIDNSVVGVGNPSSHFTASALGAFDYSGRGVNNEDFAPLTRQINALDDYIAKNLLGPDLLLQVKANIQALANATDWHNLDKAGIEAGTLQFLKQRYGTAFDAINSTVAATIRNFAGTSDELIKFINDYTIMRETVLAAQRAAKEAIESTSSDVAQILEDQSNSVLAAYRAQTRGIQGLLDIAPDTANALGTIVTGMAAFRSAAVQLLVQIENVRTAVGDMFGQTIRDLQLSLMTPEQQYAFLQNDANTLLAQALGSNDPQQIQALLTKLNQDITQAMGLLSPEQRALIAPDQITRLTEINDQVNARLNDLRDTTQADLATTLQGLSDKLDKVAEAQLAAAATQQTAADTNLAAAKTPVTVDLNLTVDGQPVGLTTTEA